MSSEFSVYCNFLEEEELPTYEEVSLPPNVTIEEREISSDDEDDDDLEELEQNIKSKQSTTTIASLKCFLPDSKTPIEVQKASITLDQSAPAISIKSDRKPTFKRKFDYFGIAFGTHADAFISFFYSNINLTNAKKCNENCIADQQYDLNPVSVHGFVFYD